MPKIGKPEILENRKFELLASLIGKERKER